MDQLLDKQGGFSRKKYLKICEELGDIPTKDKMPLDLGDFPAVVGEALQVYGKLGDRFVSTELGLLYLGKDISTLPLNLNFMGVDEEEHPLILDIVQHLDAKAIKKSSDSLKATAKKIKDKSRK